MENNITTPKKHSMISYFALAIGIICFFIVFVTPTRIANTGNMMGDIIAIVLMGVGTVLSIVEIAKTTEKKLIPIVSLILSLSLIIFWIIIFVLLVTRQIPFAP
ncbi:hypothetical protein SH601_04535 [Gracilibacillus sp. S3-1-1]|uniref:Uncharacterized protein n=1 Tax=Gracilibacillus pellucidus TaxID=3095368 RepID=A0ACC6M2R5_9BACI|nr:hypothetical protein [Gracilibacillus sp. S3-1-1]MDX8045249.1 hypothetical protein [Gracilibacillus sp. S3-1-1]